jgi:hypothetical protein
MGAPGLRHGPARAAPPCEARGSRTPPSVGSGRAAGARGRRCLAVRREPREVLAEARRGGQSAAVLQDCFGEVDRRAAGTVRCHWLCGTCFFVHRRRGETDVVSDLCAARSASTRVPDTRATADQTCTSQPSTWKSCTRMGGVTNGVMPALVRAPPRSARYTTFTIAGQRECGESAPSWAPPSE